MADVKQIAEKIGGAKNILVALSKNPSVDEVSAGLGLTLMLDKIGKKATAIYSGKTPDVLKFLKPEETFSSDTNALQDFIIALDKDKADHLRYKVDGDFVKVFITPYHEAILESDLEYSYGEFNVDLIIALDVAEEGDLDAALVEYGRIMHDAGVVNITTREGGSFSETEWSNPEASSVSEMVGELGAELAEDAFEKNSATAILTGIVAATERFANDKTTPETMGVASKLMAAGADQRLIAENIERAEMGKEQVMLEDEVSEETKPEVVEKPEEDEEKSEVVEEEPEVEEKPAVEEAPEVSEPEVEKSDEEKPEEEPKVEETAAEETEKTQEPVLETPSELVEEMPKEETAETDEENTVGKMPGEEASKAEEMPAEVSEEETPAETPKAEEETAAETPKAEEEETPAEAPKVEEAPVEMPKGDETKRKSVNLQPSAEAQEELEKMLQEEPKKNELLEEMNKQSEEQAAGGLRPDVGLSAIDTDNIGKSQVKDYGEMMAAALGGDGGTPNPAVQAAPAVMNGPEMNHIPEMDYSQVSTQVPEQPPTMQNGMLEATPTEKPAGAAQEGMTVATDEAKEPGAMPASEGMTEDILPPPPAPPAAEGMMPPGMVPEVEPMNGVPAAPVETPIAPSAPVEAPAATAPAAAEPVAPITTPSSAAPVTPVIPAMPTPEAPAAPTQVGPTPVDDNPAAFRIPGM